MRGATKLLELAAALARQRGERVALLPHLGRSLQAAGELRRAEELLDEAAQEDRDTPPSQFAFLEVTSLRDYTEATAESFGDLKRAVEDGADLSDPSARARAAILEAELRWTEGRYGAMDPPLAAARDAANDVAEDEEKRTLLNSIVGWQARALLLGPEPADGGIAKCEELLGVAKGSHSAEAEVLAVRAGLRAMRDDFDGAREDSERSLRIGQAFGLTAWLAALPLYSGPVELLGGRPGEAAKQLRRGCEALERSGDKSRRATMAGFLAHALYAQHQDREAERFARKAQQLASEEDVFTQVIWRTASAKVLARRGDCERAVAVARKAVQIAKETDSPNLLGDAQLDLAKVLSLCELSAARRQARAALKVYGEKGNLAAVRHAKALVARLAA
jgi:tetratricopeptide (TPR) repeat protein